MFSFQQKGGADLDPHQVHAGIKDGHLLLIDVREPNEHHAERIEGAVNVPLSCFDPAALPEVAGKTVVLHCAGGVRSAQALGICRKAGAGAAHHLKGGINAWKAAGLPTRR